MINNIALNIFTTKTNNQSTSSSYLIVYYFVNSFLFEESFNYFY